MPVNPPDADWRRRTCEEVIRAYAGIARLPTSPGEQQVALALAQRLRALGCEATVETVPATGSYALPIGILSALSLVAGIAAGRGPTSASAQAAVGRRCCSDNGGAGDRRRRRGRRALVPPRADSPPASPQCGGPRWRPVLQQDGRDPRPPRRGASQRQAL